MPVERVYANPRIKTDVGRVCLKRGPLVYCVEQIDNPDAVGLLKLPSAANAEAAARIDLFGGIVAVVADAKAANAADWDSDLYRPARPSYVETQLTAVPYYLWNNRGPNRMSVWIAEI
jgi:DUF1680 family protein